MKILEALVEGKRLLKTPCSAARIETPDLDAALLLAEVTGLSREKLILRGEETIGQDIFAGFTKLLERRRSGECVAYILGRKEFHGLEFTVNPFVLVPRPDTETLLEAALECIDLLARQKDISLLDLCTGSGILAISLKRERPYLHITASDISKEALKTAVLNSPLSGVSLSPGRGEAGELVFIESDLFENVGGKFNIIVSDPPYVPSGELSLLALEVQMEPRLALDGGPDGLTLIKEIVKQAPDHMLPNGTLLLEAAPEQMRVIRTILEASGFIDVKIRKDLAGRERVISGSVCS